MCESGHRYTVEDEGRQNVTYAGTDRDEAISALVTLRAGGECGHLAAEHVNGDTAEYCPDESCLAEDEAIKAWDEQDRKWQDAGRHRGPSPRRPRCSSPRPLPGHRST